MPSDADTEGQIRELEEHFRIMDLEEQKLDSSLTQAQIDRQKELDKKHCEYYFRTMKKIKGPQPTPPETIEYHQSLPIRFRATGPARRRLFLAEHSDDELDKCWGMLEKAYADMNTYQYAWIGMVMKDLSHMGHALEAVRILLVYANALLTNPKYQNARKALKILNLSERAIDESMQTMSQETGDERWDLSYQRIQTGAVYLGGLCRVGAQRRLHQLSD